jgi:hypothetical protein
MVLLALTLVIVTGPDGQKISINPDEIVSLREPRGEGHFDKNVHCLIHTGDGRFVAVTETCAEVSRLIQEDE